MIHMIFLRSENIINTLKFAQDNIKKNTQVNKEIIEEAALQILANNYEVPINLE